MVNYDFVEGFSYLGFGLMWLGFIIWWIVNNYFINRRHLKPLHKFMNFIIFCKCIECFCIMGLILNQTGAEYWTIAVTSMITIYKTFTYTSLVLASKGFCVISDILRRRELSIVALVMGSVYLIYSAYFIDPSLVSILLLCMILSLFYITTKYTLENIKLLQTRQTALIESNIQNLLAPIQAKISLLNCFLRLCYFYFIEQFVMELIYIIVYLSQGDTSSFFVSMVFFEEAFEFIGICGILFLLRPKGNMQYFDINLIEPNQPSRPLAPIYEATLPDSLPSVVVPNKPILLLAPKGYESNRPFSNLLIGNPVVIK